MKTVPGISESQAFAILLGRLREASVRYHYNARDGVTFAVNSVTEFLGTFEEVENEHLAMPFLHLSAALVDLEKGIPTPLLAQKFSKGRKPATTIRRYAISFIAATRKLMVSGGFSSKDAERKISQRLNRIGFKNLGYGGEQAATTQKTVETWCNKFAASPADDQPYQAYRSIIDAASINTELPKSQIGADLLDRLEFVLRQSGALDEAPSILTNSEDS
jgi:hypothetical protein